MRGISVIIPTKNRLDYLKATLKNLLNQSYKPVEIIVIDDGSTDGTLSYLKKFYNDKIILLINQGKGPGAARNTGYSVASGEYIKFFDSDDLMTSDMLEEQIKALSVSSKGCVYSPYFHACENEKEEWTLTDPAILQYYPAPQNKPLTHWMLRGLFITVPSFLFRKNFIDEIGSWRTDITAYEDWDYLWRVAEKEPFPLHTNKCAFLYRIHGSQTTGQHFNNYQRDYDKVKCFLQILEKIKVSASISYLDKNIFKAKINETINLYPDDDVMRSYAHLVNSPYSMFASLTMRFMYKTGRVRTKTNWQPMHSPLISASIWKEYMSKIVLE